MATIMMTTMAIMIATTMTATTAATRAAPTAAFMAATMATGVATDMADVHLCSHPCMAKTTLFCGTWTCSFAMCVNTPINDQLSHPHVSVGCVRACL